VCSRPIWLYLILKSISSKRACMLWTVDMYFLHIKSNLYL
jgi:hypothetical protein